MFVLIFFSFLAGIVTILSPCILPVLPIVLSGSMSGGKRRPLGVVAGFILSFAFFTLALSAIVRRTGLSADALRTTSIVIIFLFGITLLLPHFKVWMEKIFSKFSALAPTTKSSSGFGGGFVLGLSLGLIWTPCVGPIIASVITLAATSTINLAAVFMTLAYAIGTGVPMLLITYGGRKLIHKVPGLLHNTAKIQKVFGGIMILMAIGLFFNIDRSFQTYILQKFPNYGAGLTQLEDTNQVREQLKKIMASSAAVTELADPNGPHPSAAELISGGEWINSKPLTLAELKGKVVLIDFWTYTSINCIRTLPNLNLWYEKYADKGLVIIGVHTPQFEFEKKLSNVQKAVTDFGIKYPIMQDNDFATWNAYQNQYWPAKYFIDKDGLVRAAHFGEGAYNESEQLIQDMLKETGADLKGMVIENPGYSVSTRTPETYMGYKRIKGLASPEELKKDTASTYSTPAKLKDNEFAFGGSWTVGEERAMPTKGATLSFDFDSRQVFLVIRPTGATPVNVKVFLDGQPVSSERAGKDVKDGVLTVTEDRLHPLLKLAEPGKHVLKLEFLDGNSELYSFTFG